MPESLIIGEWPRCPRILCRSKETVALKAIEGIKVAEGAFVSLEKKVVPLEQPALAGVSVRALLTHYDVCLKCGHYRATRAEIVRVPVQMTPGQPPPPFKTR